MHEDTISALFALGKTIAAHPQDVIELRVYGDLPGHLADCIADLELDDAENNA